MIFSENTGNTGKISKNKRGKQLILNILMVENIFLIKIQCSTTNNYRQMFDSDSTMMYLNPNYFRFLYPSESAIHLKKFFSRGIGRQTCNPKK